MTRDVIDIQSYFILKISILSLLIIGLRGVKFNRVKHLKLA